MRPPSLPSVAVLRIEFRCQFVDDDHQVASGDVRRQQSSVSGGVTVQSTATEANGGGEFWEEPSEKKPARIDALHDAVLMKVGVKPRRCLRRAPFRPL